MNAGTLTPAHGLVGERRPAPALLKYYALSSLAAGPGILFLLPYRFFRYRTLRYRFDDEGVSMRWGILFRREISLTYARIQDIHLVSNLVERWFGLGRIQVQTASGQAGAEMTIEGLPDFEAVRDQLYLRMRGARGEPQPVLARTDSPALPAGDQAAVVEALNAAVNELRALRDELRDRPL